ncbi:cytidylate kinase family protein [Candidatus Parcubacteria bacterium]|nr:cytidylate kinase family protein [Candidatus Parcubacteria bacterium]
MIRVPNGLAGAGKTTAGEKVAEKYGWPFQSVGAWFREIAIERGVEPQELEIQAQFDPTVDQILDGKTLELARRSPELVIEGRRVAYILQQAFERGELREPPLKILLRCDDAVRFQRMADDPKRKEPRVEVVARQTLEREAAASVRYQVQYGMTLAELMDPARYDFIINTTHLQERAMIQAVEACVKSRFLLQKV